MACRLCDCPMAEFNTPLAVGLRTVLMGGKHNRDDDIILFAKYIDYYDTEDYVRDYDEYEYDKDDFDMCR